MDHERFPPPADLFTIDDFGGWSTVRRDVFGDDGIYTQIIAEVKGRMTVQNVASSKAGGKLQVPAPGRANLEFAFDRRDLSGGADRRAGAGDRASKGCAAGWMRCWTGVTVRRRSAPSG